jgi:hypothetical protein
MVLLLLQVFTALTEEVPVGYSMGQQSVATHMDAAPTQAVTEYDGVVLVGLPIQARVADVVHIALDGV